MVRCSNVPKATHDIHSGIRSAVRTDPNDLSTCPFPRPDTDSESPQSIGCFTDVN